jgi:hypothetical protein
MHLFTETVELAANNSYDASIIKEHLNKIFSLVKMFRVKIVFEITEKNLFYDAVTRGAHRCLEPLMKIAKEYTDRTNYDRFKGKNEYMIGENLRDAPRCS